eukprot:s2536_g1.t1
MADEPASTGGELFSPSSAESPSVKPAQDGSRPGFGRLSRVSQESAVATPKEEFDPLADFYDNRPKDVGDPLAPRESNHRRDREDAPESRETHRRKGGEVRKDEKVAAVDQDP